MGVKIVHANWGLLGASYGLLLGLARYLVAWQPVVNEN